MTFEKFKRIAEQFRPDVRVSRHGDFCNGKSKWTLGIVFIRNGRESRVYNYSGSYADILNRLDIPVITKSDVKTTLAELERCKRNHGTKDIFFGGTMDYSEEIKRLEENLEWYNSDEVVREWEM